MTLTYQSSTLLSNWDVTLDLIWVGDLPVQFDRSFSMWLQGIWLWRGWMSLEIKGPQAFLAEVRTLLDHITSLPMSFQREEPSLRGEIWHPETASQAFPILSHDFSIIYLWWLDLSAPLGVGFQEELILMQIKHVLILNEVLLIMWFLR